VIRVYNDAGDVIEAHEHKGDFKEPSSLLVTARLQDITNAIFGLSEASKESAPCENRYGKINSTKGTPMRRIIIVLVGAMITPLAFAQPVAYTSVVDHTGITQRATTQMTTSAVKIGTVTAFNPGLIPVEPPSPIVVQSSPDTKPVSYMFGRQVRFVDTDGRAIDPRLVQAGTRVELGFDRTGRVNRVIGVGTGIGPGYYPYGYYGGPSYYWHHGHRVYYRHHHHYYHTY